MDAFRNIIIALMAGTLSAVSCAVGDLEDATAPDSPFNLVLTGSVLDETGSAPVSGIAVLLYTCDEDDLAYASPEGTPVSTVTDSRGDFSISLENESPGVSYLLVTGGTDSSGQKWHRRRLEINILTDSPSYDSSSNTYNIELLPLYLTKE